MRYATIEEFRLQYPITDLCQQFGVSESGYYSWRVRPPSRRMLDDTKLEVVIRAAHKRTRETAGLDGYRKILLNRKAFRLEFTE